MTTANTTSAAQALRAALKAAGFNARRVTVRQSPSALYVSIRDAWASLSEVKAIADKFRVVRRCELSGDILDGGNTFVDVSYTAELVDPAKAAILVVLNSAPPRRVGRRPWRFPRDEGVAQVRRDLPRRSPDRRPWL